MELGDSKQTKHIELSSKHITVHQTSEEDDDNEGRRTASLGDLSKLEFSACSNGNRSNTGTLERAQSLEISDQINVAAGTKVTPKKRKAVLVDELVEVDFKEPRLSEPIIENLEALQAVRLKSAYEWGNLEDAIYDCKGKSGRASDTESNENATPKKKLSSSSIDMMTEVLAAADKFDREVIDIELKDVMADDVVDSNGDEVTENMLTSEPNSEVTWYHKLPIADDAEIINKTRRFIETEIQNGALVDKPINKRTLIEDAGGNVESDLVTQNGIPIDDTLESDRVTIINSVSNVPDDTKLTRYPFGSMERPKSEVLKKLIAQQVPATTTTTTIISNGAPQTIETVKIEAITTTASDENDMTTEPDQISAVFSSDGHGVNSISISSNESAANSDSFAQPILSTSADNIVTICTDDSQPASIILIDDENINFTLCTLDDETKATATMPPLPPPRTIKDEVFIIESLSSKKVQDISAPAIINGNTIDTEPVAPPKNFVTEIRLANIADKDQKMNAKNLSKSLSETQLVALNNNGDTQAATVKMHTVTTSSMHGNNNVTTDKPVIVEEEYIPRNAEIRFTTSTYQSPVRQFEKRHSQIDQIRSNFERQHTSEIPVPIRKLSTPSTPPPPTSITRTSPSKIPVLHSQKSSDNLLKNNNGPLANRVSVSVTSIKNSSRNPSGK